VTALWVTNNISRKHHVESLKLSQYIAITQRVFDVDMLFVKNPDLRSYFYESKLVTTNCNIQQITAIAEYILDFYSTIQEHERLLS
jgi:predicted RNase H-like nuclease